MRSGSVSGLGGSEAIGILNTNGGQLRTDGVTVLAEGGTDANDGLRNEGAVTLSVVRGGSFTGSGGSGNYGIRLLGGSSVLDAIGIEAKGYGGGELDLTFAVYVGANGSGFISQSTLFGLSNSVYCDSCSNVGIHNSRLIGGPVAGSIANINCFGISWGNAFYTDTCPTE